jgi:hypothetical protein
VLEPLLREPLLQLPPLSQWTVLTHAGRRERLGGCRGHRQLCAIAIDRAARARRGPTGRQRRTCTGTAAHSSIAGTPGSRDQVQHACGPGKTYQHLLRAGVHNPRMFPSAVQWRAWLRL